MISIIDITFLSDSQLRSEISLRGGKVTKKAKRPYLERYLRDFFGLQPKLEGVRKKEKIPPIKPIPERATASNVLVRAPMRASVGSNTELVLPPNDDVHTNVFGFSPIANSTRVD